MLRLKEPTVLFGMNASLRLMLMSPCFHPGRRRRGGKEFGCTKLVLHRSSMPSHQGRSLSRRRSKSVPPPRCKGSLMTKTQSSQPLNLKWYQKGKRTFQLKLPLRTTAVTPTPRPNGRGLRRSHQPSLTPRWFSHLRRPQAPCQHLPNQHTPSLKHYSRHTLQWSQPPGTLVQLNRSTPTLNRSDRCHPTHSPSSRRSSWSMKTKSSTSTVNHKSTNAFVGFFEPVASVFGCFHSLCVQFGDVRPQPAEVLSFR